MSSPLLDAYWEGGWSERRNHTDNWYSRAYNLQYGGGLRKSPWPVWSSSCWTRTEIRLIQCYFILLGGSWKKFGSPGTLREKLNSSIWACDRTWTNERKNLSNLFDHGEYSLYDTFGGYVGRSWVRVVKKEDGPSVRKTNDLRTTRNIDEPSIFMTNFYLQDGYVAQSPFLLLAHVPSNRFQATT